MKGLEFSIIAGLLISIVGLILLISLITGSLQNAVKWLYCDAYVKIITFFMGQDTASIPKSCRPTDVSAVVVEIKDQDNSIFSRKILSYIVVCWKDVEIKHLYKTHSCFELHLMKEVENVTEENVSSTLVNEDHCKSIENTDYGCGGKDQILWEIDGSVINKQKIILIRYDNSTEAVRVIG